MNDLWLTDEDIHGTFDENAAQRELLQNKLDNANIKIETLEDKITTCILKLQHDIDVNKRCLKENISSNLQEILALWIKYDNELLEILSDE